MYNVLYNAIIIICMMWFKYPTYNCDKEILLFEINL